MASSSVTKDESDQATETPSDNALVAAVKAALEAKPTDPLHVPVDPSSTTTSHSNSIGSWLSHPFSVTWRAALVKAPRLVPMSVLKYTVPEGPWPIKYDFKSPRGKHTIPLYIWVPGPDILNKKQSPSETGDTTPLSSVPVSLASGLPVVIDFHGGGFVLGSCLEQGPFCALMCRELGAVVISVDYRIGPIDKFPSAIWDGEDVLEAVLNEESKSGQDLRDAVTQSLEQLLKETRQQRKERRAGEKVARKEAKKAAKTEKKAKKEKKAGGSSELLKPPPASDSPPSSDISSAASSTTSLPALPSSSILDTSRIAISGFSSGGNLALNLCLDITKPHLPEPWPSRFSSTHHSAIPLLLFYPSLDSRLLPSQRTRPANLPASSPFWAEVDDILMPSYLPRNQADHPRASPGLPPVADCLHPQARPFLVLPELDTLAEQSEIWVQKVKDEGRGEQLEVLRVPGMKHGWTQFPVQWLRSEERKSREMVFQRTLEVCREVWGDKEVN